MRLKTSLLLMLLMIVLTVTAYAELLTQNEINLLISSEDCYDSEEVRSIVWAIVQKADKIIIETGEEAAKQAIIPLAGEIEALKVEKEELKKDNFYLWIATGSAGALAVILGVICCLK